MNLYYGSAPARICFAGEKLDWLSQSPAITCTIDSLRFNVFIREKKGRIIDIFELKGRKPYEIIESFKLSDAQEVANTQLSYFKAVFIVLKITGITVNKGANIFIRSNIPHGKGLSSSAALCVALLGALSKWQKLNLNRKEISHLCYFAEKSVMGIICGQLDQYAVCFGGINIVDPSRTPAKVTRLNFSNFSKTSLLIVDCGEQVKTQDMNMQIKKRLINKEEKIVRYINQAEKSVLRISELIKTSSSIHDLGKEITKVHSLIINNLRVSNPVANNIVSFAIKNGAYGAKTNGKGNVVLILCANRKAKKIKLKIEKLGYKVYSSDISRKGLKTGILKKNIL